MGWGGYLVVVATVNRGSINEVDFCGVIASAANQVFALTRDSTPFVQARIEGYGSTRGRTKRKDLRFYDEHGRVRLTGEVKMPGGPGAFDSEVVADASAKADDAGCQFFFTWDVNTFALWDRSRWQEPLLDRRVKTWPLRLNLASAEEVGRDETLAHITGRFLPDLLRELADIVSGRNQQWALPPDDVFLRSLESHLDWPVLLLRKYLHARCEREKGRGFDLKIQRWMVEQERVFTRERPEEWRDALDAAARTIAYIWCNRFIFYKALRARFPDLPALALSKRVRTGDDARARLKEFLERAVSVSGDYETLLFPDVGDWAIALAFEAEGAIDAWRSFLTGIESVDFRDVSSDIVGRIFQKLISPEERHRFGQHFTGDDPVDLINSFCIRRPGDIVLDPACGSGSFLVRAYYRMRTSPKVAHEEVIERLFGCDIALYPAHLATLNLAAREITGEANYPRIARRSFFDSRLSREWCSIPGDDGAATSVRLERVDAVVGNPPYVRQEKIGKKEKPQIRAAALEGWRDLDLSGRSDLHCYFWPHAARLLGEGGYFGFLTSAQWLDVDYGFALQRWVLKNFKIVAIMESSEERWFPDARVKTCITILRRCSDERARGENLVRFVRFEKPLKELIGVESTGSVGAAAEMSEHRRQHAVDHLRDVIEKTDKDSRTDAWRILVKKQDDLWREGVRAGSVLGDAPAEPSDEDEEEEEGSEESTELLRHAGDYAAGKWGRYVRAPDLYFELKKRFADRFVPLGELVTIRRGITSGCDAFFMPHDVTAQTLEKAATKSAFRELTGASRDEVESGALKIVEDGAGALHPIEAEYLAPEVHSLMNVERPVIHPRDVDRVILLVGKTMKELKGTWVRRYLEYGEQAIYPSRKSKAVPVPERSTCVGRDPWYDLTSLTKPAFAFWPKGSQYRHIVIGNPHRLIGNCRLNCLEFRPGTDAVPMIATGIFNGTLVGLIRNFFGRYTGTEGALDIMVLDLNLVEIPDWRGTPPQIARRLSEAYKSMCKRVIGGFAEEELMECRSYERARRLAERPVGLSAELRQEDRRELDDAVFELLGVADAGERREYVRRLHEETALFFRGVRVVEIQKMEDRRGGGGSRFTAADLAADVWDGAAMDDTTPLADWVRAHVRGTAADKDIPKDRPAVLDEGTMFDAHTVYFGKNRALHVACESRGMAELVHRMAELGTVGQVTVPVGLDESMKLRDRMDVRHEGVMRRFRELAASRTSDPDEQEAVVGLLQRWFVQGRPTAKGR